MIEMQGIKVLAVTPPGAIVDNAAFTTAEIDAIGFGYLTVIIKFGAMDIGVVALKLQESDVSGSGFTDVPGADFSVLPATLPSATDDNHIFGIQVSLVGRKRYFDVAATGGDGTAGTYMDVTAILSRASEVPKDAATRGFTQELIVI